MSIQVQHVSKRFGAFPAVDDVSLDVTSGELLGLLGPSGSGKTTLLRMIGGLESPDRGVIRLAGVDVTSRRAAERGVGFVFQHYALFRHLSVFENVAFGLRVQPAKVRPSKDAIRQRVHELLQLVQLNTMADRYPAQLSGGQRQRVALARALAVEPKILLLDEPFGALDARVRKDLRRWLRSLHERLHVTTLFVTHDQEEALELSDRVVIMNHGRVEQVGSPEAVYARPASPFVLDFLGDVNLFHCRIDNGRVSVGGVHLNGAASDAGTNGAGTVYIRPHVLSIEAQPSAGDTLPARILRVNATGPVVRVDLVTPWGDTVLVDLSRERFDPTLHRPGAQVFLRPAPGELLVVAAGDAASRAVGGSAAPRRRRDLITDLP
jgi:sulfate transport system ATP-binding protein